MAWHARWAWGGQKVGCCLVGGWGGGGQPGASESKLDRL
jgi:hypothetical protein